MRSNEIFRELNIVRNFSRILHFTTPESDSEAEFRSIKDRNKFLNNTYFKTFLFVVVWILKVEDVKIIKILTRLNPILYSEICLPFEEIEKASIAPNYLKCLQIAIGIVLFFNST